MKSFLNILTINAPCICDALTGGNKDDFNYSISALSNILIFDYAKLDLPPSFHGEMCPFECLKNNFLTLTSPHNCVVQSD